MPSYKPTVGVDDLQALFPEIAKEWHPIKNGILTPSNVKTGSHKIVWWQCSKYPDHEWYSTVKDRGIRGSSCPICQGRKVLEGFNDLKTTEPEIAKEWHPIRNGDLKPTEVTRSSNIKVWWQCNKYPDHEWDAPINNRTSGRGCPICGGKQVRVGFNDIQFTHSKITKEWHPTKNGIKKPIHFTKGSNERVWWQCSKYPDHDWQTSVAGRISKDSGCPICSGQKVLEGFNDLKSTEPEIAKEWHPTRNGSLNPTEVTRSSNKKVWWQCSKYPDHEWDSVIGNRCNGRGCPECAENGFNQGKDAWFYLMHRSGEQQLGITNDFVTRIKRHESNGWSLLDSRGPASGKLMLETETKFKQWLRNTIGLVDGTRENWETTRLEVQSLAELKAKSGIETDIF
jgi:hypothetical protein